MRRCQTPTQKLTRPPEALHGIAGPVKTIGELPLSIGKVSRIALRGAYLLINIGRHLTTRQRDVFSTAE